MSRLGKVARSKMGEEQGALFDRLAEGRTGVEDGHIGGPFDVWLRSPEMGKRIVGLGNMFRFRTSLNRRIVELAILLTGRFWKAQYEWYAHEPMARDAGLPDDIIAAIRAGEVPTLSQSDDRAAYDLVMELHQTHAVSDATFQAAQAAFGDRGVAELINLIGYYTMVSMTLNTFDVALPAGAELPLD